MKSLFSADFFAGNRRALQQQTKADLIVVTANGLLQRGGDSTFPFRQDSNFWYLTGIDDPDVVLVMDGEREYLIVPGRDAVRAAFDGALNLGLMAKQSGVKDIVDETVGWRRLRLSLRAAKQVATILPSPTYIKRYGFYTNPARTRLVRRLKTVHSGTTLEDLRSYLTQLRMVKQASELAAIKRAVTITTETMRSVLKSAKNYAHEYEVETALTIGFRRRGASGHAYDPVVASGAHACTLHYVANNGPLTAGSLLLVDAGAEVSHYAADITRTVASSTRPTKRQQAVFAAVEAVQQFAKAQLKPGVLLKEYETAVAGAMGEQLQTLGLINNPSRKNIRHYYPHATSHFLGLDVHDVGDYSQPLAPGMVLTVEPGIYIADEALGIRIEDDVLITPTGVEVLSKGLSSSELSFASA